MAASRPGNPAGFFAQYVKEGLSARAAISRFRDAGGQIGNERGRALYAMVRDAVARSPEMLAVDPFAIPSANDYATWQMGRGGQYATQVAIFVRDRATNTTFTKQFTHVTDQPHSKAEAQEEAEDEFADPDVAADYGEDVLGTLATAIYATVPYGE